MEGHFQLTHPRITVYKLRQLSWLEFSRGQEWLLLMGRIVDGQWMHEPWPERAFRKVSHFLHRRLGVVERVPLTTGGRGVGNVRVTCVCYVPGAALNALQVLATTLNIGTVSVLK